MTTDPIKSPAEADKPEQPETAAQAQAEAAARPRRGRWIALGTVGVLLAVATGVGVGDAILDAEKKPAPSSAQAARPAPPAYGGNADGSHFGSLGDLLLPVAGTAGPGADDPAFGNDTVLAPAQYRPFFDEDFGALSGGDRSTLAGLLDLGGLKGAALRTYDLSDELDVEIGLFQVTDARVSAGPAIVQELANATSSFATSGPVTGYPRAHCYRPPLPQEGDRLDYLDCDAVAGDVLVTVQAFGAAPMDTSSVTDLLQQQLTRLAPPEDQT
ncbi:hypothetical protein GXW83_00480 [Streptacidiphilus sp. PB12-B1b]|uniref:hypothetical protein n=1 Tax=Streptacidiphilus sp. PB12-B1b TaxID=2705012 RepID=UPI0015F8CBE2|nr:hypothetical protein [Streptacidiphilus sp. PB12-B1b]QMU74491.1 hypothetical protein GXW83_00480 [Streptacidiphilus sp. PB12-B1b]